MSSCISSTYSRALVLLIFLFSFFTSNAQTDSTTKKLLIESITITGNKKTRDRIILRELVKQVGDSVLLSEIAATSLRSQQNIFNTQLFIYDSLKYQVNNETGKVSLNIKVKERWYLIPELILEIQDRNINSWWVNKDPFRINYGVSLDWNNVFGIKDKLSFTFRRGYSEKYGVEYRIPYINHQQTLGLNFAFGYSRNNEVAYSTENNALLFHRDYGKYMRFEYEGKVGATLRRGLYGRHSLEALYNTTMIDDTIRLLNPDFFKQALGKISYVSLQYRFSYDKRDNKPYPLKGWAVDLAVIKDGFNFDNTINNLYALASVKKHSQFAKRIFIANQIKARYMDPDKLPYYFNKALGYADFIRGYEYFVMDGQSFVLFKNSLKFQIIKPKLFELKFLKRLPQFSTVPFSMYLTFNGDAGYVDDKFYGKTNLLSNSWQYGYGIGLDLVTYYDIVVRLEYSLNKQTQSGFFIHIGAVM